MSDVQTLFESARKLAPDDKLKLIQDLWDDFSAQPENVPVPDWQIRELERRRTEFLKNPSSGLTLEEFKRRIRERHGQ
ncbi:MAG: addiction module protein [Planctomycetaceae bacterium]